MKKNVFIGMALAITVLSACSNNDALTVDDEANVVPTVEQADEFAQIKADIAAYSAKRMEVNGTTVDHSNMTRSWWSNFWKAVKSVFMADATGFITNSVTTRSNYVGEQMKEREGNAVVASIVQTINVIFHPNTSNQKNIGLSQAPRYQVSLTRPDSLALDSTVIFPRQGAVNTGTPNYGINKGEVLQIDSAGYYHNAAIVEVFKQVPQAQTLVNMSNKELLNVVNTSVEKVMSLIPGSLQKDSLYNSRVLANIEAARNNTSTEVEVKDPDMKEILSVIETYLNKMYETEGENGNWSEYSKGVISIIDKSNLSEEKKERLRSAATVAFASTQLWNMDAFKE